MTKAEKFAAARKFAHRVIQASWDSTEVDTSDIQDWAKELGLIFARKATKEDEARYSEICAGDDMLEFEDWMQIPSPPDGLPYR